MFCHECGKPARGKFCSSCGSPLEPIDAPPVDWENELRYDLLLRVPHVRQAIDRHAALAKKRMTGRQFLALCDKIASPPVSSETLAGIVQPLYARMGIHTGKRRSATLHEPPGRVLCRILCSLARNGQTIRRVRQSNDACALEAALPSDLLSFEGDLLVTVRRDGESTTVEAATDIGGQLFDWGKSRRCLDALFADIRDDAVEIAA